MSLASARTARSCSCLTAPSDRFMTNEVSAEVNKEIAIAAAAREMRATRARGAKIVVVPGPAGVLDLLRQLAVDAAAR